MEEGNVPDTCKGDSAVNPFDLKGPSFLWFFLALIAVGVVAGLVLRRALRGPGPAADDPPPDLSPDEIACLAGGRKLAVDAAIANLVQRNSLAMDADNRKLIPGPEAQKPSSRIEAAARAVAEERPDGVSINEVRQGAIRAAQEVEQVLEEKGL